MLNSKLLILVLLCYFSAYSFSQENKGIGRIIYDDKDQQTQIPEKIKSASSLKTEQIDFDVASLININSPEEVIQKQQDIIKLFWGDAGFPIHKIPNNVTKGITDKDFEFLENLKQIDKLLVEMEFGLNSIIYHFIPTKAKGDAAIYHQGHGGKFLKGFQTINAFLKNGYDVYAMSMPLLGMNAKPVVDSQRFGKITIFKHSVMDFLLPEQGHPIKFFMEPVAAVVNYMQKFDYENLIMIGLSGGGWTTTLYAAIDPRIRISIPVAGSLPLYLRVQDISNSGSLGDYEQLVAELYSKVNYLELYVLGSIGQNRFQLQILNEFDACCFGGTGFKTYEHILKDKIESLGNGRYEVFLDSSHRLHQVSPLALEVIFEYLSDL